MSGSITTLGISLEMSEEIEQKRAQRQAENETLQDVFAPHQLRWDNIDWVVTGFLAFIHIGALAAFVPAMFSWEGLAICALLHWFTCSVGICLECHRYLAHKSLKLKSILLLCW